MSYILDALRKADAERDPSRGIHAQPARPATSPGGRGGTPAGLGIAVAVVVAGAAAMAMWNHERATVAAPAPVPATPPAPVSAAGPHAAVPATTVQPPAPPSPPPAPPPAPVAVAVPRVPAMLTPAVATPSQGATAPAAAPMRVVAFSELPPDVQRELPKLVITGGVHSENAAQRMLVVGGRVLTEGAELAPGVVLEQIRPRSAVLRYRGYHYSVAY